MKLKSCDPRSGVAFFCAAQNFMIGRKEAHADMETKKEQT